MPPPAAGESRAFVMKSRYWGIRRSFGSAFIQFFSVKGHWFLPGGGHEACPLAATRTARWCHGICPLGGGHHRVEVRG